jgi:hypothetical protein
VYDATFKTGQSFEGHNDYLRLVKLLRQRAMELGGAFFGSLALQYVCDPADKPADIERCDRSVMPTEGNEGEWTICTLPANIFTSSPYLKNGVSGVSNVVIGGRLLVPLEGGQSGWLQDGLQMMFGFARDYDGSPVPGDSVFNNDIPGSNFFHARDITALDRVMARTVLGMPNGALSTLSGTTTSRQGAIASFGFEAPARDAAKRGDRQPPMFTTRDVVQPESVVPIVRRPL